MKEDMSEIFDIESNESYSTENTNNDIDLDKPDKGDLNKDHHNDYHEHHDHGHTYHDQNHNCHKEHNNEHIHNSSDNNCCDYEHNKSGNSNNTTENEEELDNDFLKDLNNENSDPTKDFISYNEVNFFLMYQTRNNTLNGFRKGKIPLEILHMQNPQLIQNMFEMMLNMKNENLKLENKYAAISNISNDENGFIINYTINDINNTNENNSQNDELNNESQDQDL